MKDRIQTFSRKTAETAIDLTLNLDGAGQAEIDTGIGFLDHMLTALTRHARFDLTLTCRGDLEVDDHHSAEDSGIALGQAIDQALGKREGIERFGSAFAPLDEALARAVVDLSGRPFADISLDTRGERIGALTATNAAHVIQSIAMASRACIHVDVLKGADDHHRVEAGFKALALALKQAVRRDGTDKVPSTKEVL